MATRELTLVSLLVSLWLLCGCQSAKSCEVVHVDGAGPDFSSARLTFPIRDRVHGMGVHMISTPGQLSAYLEVHLQTIPPYRSNPKEALVKMTMDGKTHQGVAYRHDGGQRVSLSSEMNHLLIEALKQKQSVTLQLEGYTATLDPQDFSEQYEKLQAAPIKNRLQLPFKL